VDPRLCRGSLYQDKKELKKFTEWNINTAMFLIATHEDIGLNEPAPTPNNKHQTIPNNKL
jgi:hypothetical protein